MSDNLIARLIRHQGCVITRPIDDERYMLRTPSRVGASSGVTESRARSVRIVTFWVVVSLALGLWVLATEGRTAAPEYYAAYFLEESLSIDNIFVFVIIFSELHIPDQYQRRVLRFGVLGALVFRALLISAGIAVIERFQLDNISFRRPDPLRGVEDALRGGTGAGSGAGRVQRV
jgi:hypothetical protein